MYPRCPICFNNTNKMVSCFSGCTLDCCLSCFCKIIKLNEVDRVQFDCPQCRGSSIQSRDRRFDNFIKNNNFLKTLPYASPIFRYAFDGKNFDPMTIFETK